MATDPVFEQEQQHLTETHDKLKTIAQEAARAMEARMREALGSRNDMLDELFVDFGNGVNLETYVEYEAMHKIIDDYNLANTMDGERLDKATLLLRKPYFAKVSLQLRPGAPARDIYIGNAGMVDEKRRHFIVDWRSPVAETYYNQSNGKTSYTANGRVIEADLLLRRQFDIEGATLNNYFDTTVAIEDPLLLKSLARGRNAKLSDITATIQKEQNTVVRHEDVPALLVHGIAGSGKTSVLLQRIAYLFYRERENLDPKDVYLISPNPVFASYIDNVLPDMGEENPQTVTWKKLMAGMGLDNRALGEGSSANDLRLIDELLPGLQLDPRDFQDICVDEEKVITAGLARNVYKQYKSFPVGPHRAALAAEELQDRLQQRIERLSKSDDTFDAMQDLPLEEQLRLFGMPIQTTNEEELRDLATKYLTDRYAPVVDAIEDGQWLRVDRIGMRLLKKKALSAAEWLYLKLALAGGGNRHARYVMVDEVQDYSEAQLMVMARYFHNAHFLMLGDENQAIREGTATFDQIREVFTAAKGGVSECQLMTSYRSSPEITALFTSLMDEDKRVRTSSVQREGNAPRIISCTTDDEYRTTVRETIAKADPEALTAVVVADRGRAKWMAKWLDEGSFTLLDSHAQLPERGVLLVDLPLAKGLEFDEVIIPDVQPAVYDESLLSRHRLYTAISRATQRVTLIAQGALSPLIQGE